jgi:rhodanese-related sulfurtransferase
VTSRRPAEISPESARFFLAQERATFIDARPSTEYEASGVRIPGAVQAGAGSGVDLLELIKAIPDDRTIIVYCDQPHQEASALIAQRVHELGLGQAFYLKGGFSAWRDERHPIERIPDVAVAPEAQPGG